MSTQYSPQKYWSDIASKYGDSEAGHLSPVLHPDAPAWFNRLIDRMQWRALQRALKYATFPSGARILDVGCGTGRWLQRYTTMGFQATGIDATPPMLALARKNGSLTSLVAGESFRLPFDDCIFDGVSDVTVIQHIPYPAQTEALHEMMRVLKPGGRLILMELIGGEGPHIFPRVPQDWIEQSHLCGASLVVWFGQEFMLFDRAFVHMARKLFRRGIKIPAQRTAAMNTTTSVALRVFWNLRHLTAPLSAWADPAVGSVISGKAATHAVFVFRK